MQVQGFSTGTPSRKGRLTIWPLEAPDVPGLGFIGDVGLASDRRGYGNVQVKSNNGPAIAPWGMVFYMDGGQDRALREAAYVPAHGTVNVEAMCVEPGTGGFWEEGEKVEVSMLLPSLRASQPSGGGFSALWDSIKRRALSVGSEANDVRGLLVGAVQSDVQVSAMRGAIVCLDGRPIAVEIAPTATQFSDWWHNYGLATALEFEARTLPSMPLPLGQTEVESLSPGDDGLAQVTAWQVLKGWVYVLGGEFAYVSLVDGEALLLFEQQAESRVRERPQEWEVPNDD